MLFSYYDVNEYGVVVRRDSGRVMSVQTSVKGYKSVGCCVNKKVYSVRVHRFVALKYLANPFGYEQVNHKDGDKGNNHVSNLEWCSGFQNYTHAVKTGLHKRGGEHRYARLSDVDVLGVRGRILGGESFKNIYKDYDGVISWWGFRDICRGRSYRHVEVK